MLLQAQFNVIRYELHDIKITMRYNNLISILSNIFIFLHQAV